MDAVTLLMIQQRWPKQLLVLQIEFGASINVWVHAGCVDGSDLGFALKLEFPTGENLPRRSHPRCGLCAKEVEFHYREYDRTITCRDGIPPEELKALL